MSADALAAALAAPDAGVGMRYATVSAVNGDATVDLDIGGTTATVRRAESYPNPVVGDRVLVSSLSGVPFAVARVAETSSIPVLSGQRGSQNVTFPGGATSQSVTVNFPVTFPAAPVAFSFSMPLLNLVAPAFGIGTPSTTSIQVVIEKIDGSVIAAQTQPLRWLAIL